MGENSERPFDRRTILKTIGAGVAVPTLGGVASANNGNGNGGGDISADCQFLRAKYEYDEEDGTLTFEDGVGDSLNITSGDDIVDFTITKTKEDSDEILAFEWDSDPYAMSTVVVKAGQNTFEKTYSIGTRSGSFDLEAEDNDPPIQAVSNVSFGAALYLQADVITGSDFEDPPYLASGSADSGDGLIKAASGNSCVDNGRGAILQYPDDYEDDGKTEFFTDLFGGILRDDTDIDMNNLNLGEGDVQFSFELENTATLESSHDTFSDLEGVYTDSDGNNIFELSLAVYERPGPAVTRDSDGTIDIEEFSIEYQELMSTDTVQFTTSGGFDSESGSDEDSPDDPLTTSF